MKLRQSRRIVSLSSIRWNMLRLFSILAFGTCLTGESPLHGAPLQVLARTNTEPVRALAFSPDGKVLAVGSSAPALVQGLEPWDERLPEGTIEIWDLPSGNLTRVLRQSASREDGSGTANRVVSLHFSPDGQQLLGSDAVGYILWDWKTGEPKAKWHGMLSNYASSPDWSADGRTLALPWMENSGRSPGVAVVDATTGNELKFIPVRKTGYVMSARFSPDGRLLATAGQDCEVRVFDLLSGQELLTDETGGILHAACFAPNGRELVAGSSWGGVLLRYEVTNDGGKCVVAKKGTSAATAEEIHFVEFTPDGKRALSVSHMGIRIWDATTWTNSTRILKCIARLSPDGTKIALVQKDNPTRIQLWRLDELPAEAAPILR